MARHPLGKHGRDHRPKGTYGTDDPGGHDPIPLPAGLLFGSSGLDIAYAQPGSLMWLYRMGNTFTFPTAPTTTVGPALLDTSSFDGTARNMNYREDNGVTGWSNSHRPTLAVVDHAALGTADDGCVDFGFSFTGDGPGGYTCFYHTMEAPVDPTWGTGTHQLSTIMAWFKPHSAQAGNVNYGLIHGTWEGVGGGLVNGVGLFYDYVNGRPFFNHRSAFGVNETVAMSSGSLAYDAWYHIAAAFDGTTTYLYVNGVLVASGPVTAGSGASNVYIGGTLAPSNPSLVAVSAVGKIDDCAGFATELTQAEIAAIYSGSGYAGEVGSVTVGAGPTGTPGGLTSVVSGADAPAHQVFASDGAGGSVLEYPTIDFLVDGA